MNHLIAVVGIVFVRPIPHLGCSRGRVPSHGGVFSIYALPALTLIWFFAGRGDERSARARMLAVAKWHSARARFDGLIPYVGAGQHAFEPPGRKHA